MPWLKSKGGVERIILCLLKDNKYKIDVYTLDYQKEKTFEEFKNYRIRELRKTGEGPFITRGVKLFFNILFSKIDNLGDYDLFLISTAGISEFAVFRNRHRNTVALTHTPLRVAHTMYDYYKKSSMKYRIALPPLVWAYRLMERRAWKHIDYAIVLSDEIKNRLVDYKLMQKNRIFKIGPSADYSRVKTKKAEKIIFYASRFISYKRQDLAVEAFRKSKLPALGFKLVLGGFVEDKRYFDYLENLAGADKNIILKTNLKDSELKDLYSKCYATLFLAINEDTGLVPLESLAYGKPVVSVNEGGPREFIKNNVNGMLINAGVKNLADALNKLSNKRFYQKLCKGARNSKRYSEETMLSNFNSAVHDVLSWEKRKA